MTESETNKKDKFTGLINSIGKDKAPEGLSEKIMARIEVESSLAPFINKNLISWQFKAGATIVFIILISLAFLLPSVSEYSWYQSIGGWMSNIKPVEISISEIPLLLTAAKYLLYISAGVFFFLLIDRLLAMRFSDKT